MTKLDYLIDEYCPDGVEYKKIKDIFTRLKGTPITASKMKEIDNPDGDIRIFAGGKTVINAFESDIPNPNITRVPAVLVQSRGVIDAVYYDKPFTFKNEMWAYTHEEVITIKYLYYVLKNNVEYFRNAASGMGSLPQISLGVTEEFRIPVPPLEIQREIVQILDEYTAKNEELKKKLEEELDARRKEFGYFRNELLSFSETVKRSPLNDITNSISSGKNKEKSSEGLYPVYGSTGIIAQTDEYVYTKEQILVARVGANAGYIQIANGSYDVSDNTLILDVKQAYLLKYIYYALINMNINQYAKGGGQPLITAGQLKKITIPIPSQDVQREVADCLDHFYETYNEINRNLLDEIIARQKQYEYYRDKLLTFKEKEA